MQEENQNILEVKNLSKYFTEPFCGLFQKKRKKVLDGVSFILRKGESYGLAGKSGCGKSTLARTLMGAYSPDEGEIWLKGRRIDCLNTREKRSMYGEIQMVFQDSYSSLNPCMTAGRIVEEPLAVRSQCGGAERKELVRGLMDQMGFTADDLGKYPHEFSGGQRQKIAIARALAVEPEILICDEPLVSLDLRTKAQIMELLEQTRKARGMTFLYISHEMGEVQRMCSRMGIMSEGKMIEERRVL